MVAGVIGIMVGVLTFTGVGSAFAASPNRFDPVFERLGVVASTEQTKPTAYEGLIFKIGSSNYLAFTDISGGNNVSKKIDTCPIIENSRTMLPLRAACESLGAEVDYDDKTQEINITKDDKEIKFKIGSSIMKVNGNKSSLDVAPHIDANNRTLVPLRAIAESFGKTVLWDKDTETILIGFTGAQKNDYFNSITTKTEVSTDVINVNASEMVSKFMAGGEFMNVAEEGLFAIKDKQSGAVVVFSDEDFLKVDKTISLIEKSEYLNKSIINNIRDKLNSNDCVYVLNGEAYVFNDENLKEGNKTLTKYDAYGNQTTIINDKVTMFYFSRLAFDKNLGICVFDGTKITYKLNTQTKQFDELPSPEFVGTLEQRTIHNLEAAYNARWANRKGTNPFDLNYQDILEYKNTGSDANCKSFKLIKVSDNLGFICLTGGQCGLQDEKTLENLKIAIQKCNNIDPVITQKWIERGLDFLAINEMSEPVFSGASKNWWGTFIVRNYGGIIWLNEKVNPFILSPFAIFSVLEEESNGLKYEVYIVKSWNGTVNGFSYTEIEDYKHGEFEKTADKYLPSDWREVGFGD